MSQVSIVVPSLGATENLQKLIRSVDQQSIPASEIEVIVVLNGASVEKSKSLTEELSKIREGIKILSINERGANVARNRGLVEAQSEIAFFSDDDCEFHLKDTLSRHLKMHHERPDLFAIGGAYKPADDARKFDLIYHYLQMRWFYSGILSDLQQAVLPTRHLLGGNFSLKIQQQKKFGLWFDEAIQYGGSELEFFVKAQLNGLSLATVDVDVTHNTCESVFSIAKKVFKQGRGKRIIDLRYPEYDSRFRDANLINLKPPFSLAFSLLYNYSFWLGYYSVDRSYFSFVKHLFLDFFKYLNFLRFEIIKKLNR